MATKRKGRGASKGAPDSAPKTKRPERRLPPLPATYEERVAYVIAENERPIVKAYSKFFDFVNGTVSDPDFRHPDSRSLLDFLLLARDVLADGINEQWNLDDILAPVSTAMSKARGMKAAGKPKPKRKTKLRLGLEKLVKEGLDNDQILDLLSDADDISSRALHGFPFEVIEPETSVSKDGVLRWFPTGGNSDQAKSVKVVDIQKLLSTIRKSQSRIRASQ